MLDGKFPYTCRGELKIMVNGTVIYKKSSCCASTGSVSFDDDYNAHVVSGELIWNDADKFSAEIQQAVREKLSEYSVCCGGCA